MILEKVISNHIDDGRSQRLLNILNNIQKRKIIIPRIFEIDHDAYDVKYSLFAPTRY